MTSVRGTRAEFLEPLYLNEQMILNCAAYLFSGVPTESETSTVSEKSKRFGGRLRFSALTEWLGLPDAEASTARRSEEQNRIARQFTAGGLHMSVLDELRDRQMIKSINASELDLESISGTEYVDIVGVLEPSDYYSLLGTTGILVPLVSQIMKDYGDQILPNLNFDPDPQEDALSSVEHNPVSPVEKYEQSIAKVVAQLEADYLTSGQLEMVLWTERGDVPVGVVDLALGELKAAEIRTRLSGGQYHVIGKVSRVFVEGETIELLQKTVFWNTVNLLNKLMALGTDEQRLTKFRNEAGAVSALIQNLLLLRIPGPALRLNAMSVCV
ncbi:MAG: hypothetical protein KF883_13430 [Thermomicrobiales bacterium]|nr:hypothetical protein [Thermomicrobiales bacterium]